MSVIIVDLPSQFKSDYWKPFIRNFWYYTLQRYFITSWSQYPHPLGNGPRGNGPRGSGDNLWYPRWGPGPTGCLFKTPLRESQDFENIPKWRHCMIQTRGYANKMSWNTMAWCFWEHQKWRVLKQSQQYSHF